MSKRKWLSIQITPTYAYFTCPGRRCTAPMWITDDTKLTCTDCGIEFNILQKESKRLLIEVKEHENQS